MALGLPIQLVTGYKGTAEIRLAADSGELAGGCWAWDSVKVTWRKAIEDGDVVVVLQGVARAFPDLPAAPLAIDLARTDDARRLVQLVVHHGGAFARPFVLSPGTPPSASSSCAGPSRRR